MRLPGLRHRSGQVLALLGVAIVLPAWVVVFLTDRVHRRLIRLRLPHPRLPRLRYPRDALVIGLGVLVIAAWSMGVAVMGIGPLLSHEDNPFRFVEGIRVYRVFLE